jgi:hypothetical protein
VRTKRRRSDRPAGGPGRFSYNRPQFVARWPLFSAVLLRDGQRSRNHATVGALVNVVVSLVLAGLLAAGPAIKPRSLHETLARDILINLNLGQFEAAVRDFNPTLRAAISPAGIAELKQQFDAQVGAFRSVVGVREGKEEGFPMVEVTARFAEADVLMRVVFDAGNKIGAVYFNPIVPPPPDAKLEAIARGLLTNLAARRFDLVNNTFDVQLKAQLTPERLAALSSDLSDQYGGFKSIRKVRQVNEAAVRSIDLVSDWEKQPAVVRVVFNSWGAVVGLHVSPELSAR